MSLLENLNLRWKGRSRPTVRSTRRPGAARRRLLMEHLEPRIVMTGYVLSGDAGDDVILVRRDPSNAAAIEVKITQGTQTRTDVSLAVVSGDTITIDAGDGNNTFNVEDTFLNVPVTLNGGNGNDTANITPTGRFLDTIDGDVTLDGGAGGTNVLNTYDQSDTFNDTYTETSSSVQRSFSAKINYSAIGTVNVYSGTGNVTHRVESTAAGAGATTRITAGSGNDTFTLSPTARDFGTIAGHLILNGGPGNNSLRIEDQANPASSTFTVTSATVARTFSATVNYAAMGGGVIIDGGSGAVTYNILSTFTGNPVTINAGANNDTFVVGPTARNLDLIRSNLVLSGGLGVNQVVVDDQNNPNPDAWTLTSSTLSRTNSATITLLSTGMIRTVNAGPGNNTVNVLSTPVSGSLAFNAGGGVNTLVAPNSVNTIDITGLNAGSINLLRFSFVQNIQGNVQADRFVFGPTGSISGAVDGGAGVPNTLDFTAKTAPVSVNLLTGSSNDVGVVSRVQNVYGGSGNDTLIGNAQANILQGNGGNDIIVGNAGNDTINGGAGRDVLIGGLGADKLNGGTDDDLLINGTTSYDANIPALQAILNEWASANSYATRINDLRSGGGLSGGNYLQAAGAGRTVFDDGVADSQTGGPGLDWFFTGTGDAITDLNNGGPETVN